MLIPRSILYPFGWIGVPELYGEIPDYDAPDYDKLSSEFFKHKKADGSFDDFSMIRLRIYAINHKISQFEIRRENANPHDDLIIMSYYDKVSGLRRERLYPVKAACT